MDQNQLQSQLHDPQDMLTEQIFVGQLTKKLTFVDLGKVIEIRRRF